MTNEPSCKDEARVGQQGTLTRIWAKRGTRPRIKRDRRFTWAKPAKGSGRRSLLEWPAEGYMFGAICPARGTGAALVMPTVSIEAINQHLAEISTCVSLGAIALLILDGAGWHSSPHLIVPENIVLMPLPPYAPELNSVDPSTGSGHMGLSAQQLSQPLRLGHLRGDPRRLLRCLERPDRQIRGLRINWNQRLGTGQDLGRLV